MSDVWPPGTFDVSVFGPNGFYRRFQGSGAGARPGVECQSRVVDGIAGIEIGLQPAGAAAEVIARGGAPIYRHEEQRIRLGLRRAGRRLRWKLPETGGWYDLSLTLSSDPAWSVRLSGRVETGRPSISDPGMGGAAVMTWAV